TLLVSIIWILSTAITTFACTATGHDPKIMVAEADLILRATALEYVGPELPVGTRSLSNSNIRFSVEEVVKGRYEKPTLILPGFLTDRDDWNRQNPPYMSARPTADASCFAHGYRKVLKSLPAAHWMATPSVGPLWVPSMSNSVHRTI